MKYVLITGVSTGIGEAIARKLIENQINVFGTVRKLPDAEKLRKLSEEFFTPLVMDVTDREAINESANSVKENLGEQKLDALINNAGIAVTGPWEFIDPGKLRNQFEVNIFGVVDMIQAFLPLMIKENSSGGRIINISSVAGRFAMPFGGPYSASKHALEALSDALRRELLLYGIEVIVIQPGPIKTPIWEKAFKSVEPFRGTIYQPYMEERVKYAKKTMDKAMDSSEVADRTYKILLDKKPKTRYVVTKEKLKNWYLPKILPDRFLDKAIQKMLKMSSGG